MSEFPALKYFTVRKP